MFWCRVLHIVSCISSRLWWGILLADFAITRLHRHCLWWSRNYLVGAKLSFESPWSLDGAPVLTDILPFLSLEAYHQISQKKKKHKSKINHPIVQVIGNGNGWAKENVSLSLLRCAFFAAVLPSLGDCCFGDDGFLVGTVVQLCSCVGDLLDFRGPSTPTLHLFPKKNCYQDLSWDDFPTNRVFLPTSLPSPMHPTNAVLRSWFHGGWPSNMLPSWFCCHWFCTLEFEQKRDEIKVRGVDVTKIVGYLITVSCFLFNVFSMCFCWVWCLEKHGQILYRQNFDVVTAKENSYPASLQAIYWCNMYCQQACGFFMFGQKFDCKDR